MLTCHTQTTTTHVSTTQPSYFYTSLAKYYSHKKVNVVCWDLLATRRMQKNVSNNNTAKNLDDAGQLVTYYSWDMSLIATPSQKFTFETIIFRLAQAVGDVISFFGVCYQCTFSVFLLALCGRFSNRVLDLRNTSLFDVRNDYAKHMKIWKKHTSNTPKK